MLLPGKEDLILDAGCGAGKFAQSLLTFGSKIVGVDISFQMLKYCAKNLLKSFKSINADLNKLPFKDNIFDKIYSVGVLMHVEDVDLVIKEFRRVLKKGGSVVIVNNNLLLFYFSLFYLPLLFLRKIIFFRKTYEIIRYRSPFWYKRLLEKNGMKVKEIRGDSFIATLKIKKIKFFPPQVFLPFFKWVDRLVDVKPFKYFSFNNFLKGIKE